MPKTKHSLLLKVSLLAILLMTFLLSGCIGKTLERTTDNRLEIGSCVSLPNCVSSNASVLYNYVEPFQLAMSKEEAWPLVREAVLEISRAVIVEEDDLYLHAKISSMVFRFVDNLELLYQADEHLIEVRSSSVLGLYDLSANRIRVEALHKALIAKGVVKE